MCRFFTIPLVFNDIFMVLICSIVGRRKVFKGIQYCMTAFVRRHLSDVLVLPTKMGHIFITWYSKPISFLQILRLPTIKKTRAKYKKVPLGHKVHCLSFPLSIFQPHACPCPPQWQSFCNNGESQQVVSLHQEKSERQYCSLWGSFLTSFLESLKSLCFLNSCRFSGKCHL